MDLAFWRDISLIWLSLICFVALVIPLGIAYFAVKGINALSARVPPLLHQAQELSHTVRTRTESASLQVATPVIRTRRQATRLTTALRALWPRSPRDLSAKETIHEP